MNLFVGNLSFKATDDDLRAAFEAHGTVTSARVVKDRDSGRSRGFGFIEMPDATQAQKAIAALNDQPIAGRPVKVNEAKPREERPPR